MLSLPKSIVLLLVLALHQTEPYRNGFHAALALTDLQGSESDKIMSQKDLPYKS
jgi:hypothetical protein